MIRDALARVSVKDAVSEIVAATGLPRREVYQRALELAKENVTTRASESSARAAAASAGRVPARPVGREPRRRLSARQGLSHRRAALAHARPAKSTSWRGAAIF